MPQSVTTDMSDDLAYVRALAEEGANAPLIGGVHYLIWGSVMSLASLVAWLNAAGVIKASVAGMIAPWFVALVVGWGASIMVARRARARPGAMTLGNKTAGSVWFAVGVLMTALFIGILAAHGRYQSLGVPRYFLFSILFPIGFGLYGVAFFATATAARITWLRGFAWASWGFALLCLFLLGSVTQFLVGAAGLFACAAIPGLILMKNEPQDVV